MLFWDDVGDPCIVVNGLDRLSISLFQSDRWSCC